jgi:hypothetical protein
LDSLPPMADLAVKPTKATMMDLNTLGKGSSQLKAVLETFKMRSPDREVAVDQARISSVAGAIDGAIQDMVAERTGLIARVKAIVDQPQVVLKQRLWQRKPQSDLSADEFLRAEQRLNVLAQQISDLELLKASVLETFSGVKRQPPVAAVSMAK